MRLYQNFIHTYHRLGGYLIFYKMTNTNEEMNNALSYYRKTLPKWLLLYHIDLIGWVDVYRYHLIPYYLDIA